ncbi:uncharacterized protein BJ212DRAFT_818692 [Suillus subaureus]|uniref:Uncharacterized protein n=1 Tax=Suillus subaureus TaxID=48587 RepID=A0A9P7EI85_9AGAM|nr:uncharacterized protein BJ212DRAFT_818692 [Suillus subaureus]KAG1822646.1 hypothetical protein BJ212DRAFT_818692 [Suillus subaureus]
MDTIHSSLVLFGITSFRGVALAMSWAGGHRKVGREKWWKYIVNALHIKETHSYLTPKPCSRLRRNTRCHRIKSPRQAFEICRDAHLDSQEPAEVLVQYLEEAEENSRCSGVNSDTEACSYLTPKP